MSADCTMEEAGFLKYKFLFRDHFLPTDFMTPEQIVSSLWLGLSFIFHPTVFSALVSYPFQHTTLSSKSSDLPVLPPFPLTSEWTQRKIAFKSCHPWEPTSYPCPLPILRLLFLLTQTVHFLSNLCTKSYTSSSQHIFCGRHLLVPQLRFFHCFLWGIRVLQWSKFFLKAYNKIFCVKRT